MKPKNREGQNTDAEIRKACIAALNAILPEAEIVFTSNIQRGDQEYDGELGLRGSWGTINLTVESKRRVLTETIRPMIAQIKQRTPPAKLLLMTEFINPEAASILRDEKINFVDAAGNIHLNVPPLFVWQQGFRRDTPTHRPNRLFQVVGLKLLSVLLWEPDAVNATYRDLAKRAGVSLGAIVPIFDDLTKGGFLITKNKRRQLARQQALLEQWVLGYAGQLFPRLILKTCRLAQGRTIESLAEDLRHARFIGNVLLGGELAAGMATGYLRPARAAVHLAPEDQGTWMKRLKLIPDPQGNVDLIQRYAEGNKWAAPPIELEGIQCVNPVLIYGELLRISADDRLNETADLLFQKFITPRFGPDK